MKAGEGKLVERIVDALAPKGGPYLALGVGDDAALQRPRKGYETILTCDWFLEGSHFLRGTHRRTRSAGNAWRARLATLLLWAASQSASSSAWRFPKPLPVAGWTGSWRDCGAPRAALPAR